MGNTLTSEYVDSLNFDLKTQEDIEKMLLEFEKGNLNKEQYIAVMFMALSVSHSNGFSAGFESGSRRFLKQQV